MIYQTDERLRLEARDDECYMFDILRIHELEGDHEFTVRQVDGIHRLSVRMGWMRLDGWLGVDGPSGIAYEASGVAGVHVQIDRVTEDDDYNFLIGRYNRKTNKGKEVTHFVLMDMDNPKKVIYDPWDKGGSKTVRIGKLTEYRYIKARLL